MVDERKYKSPEHKLCGKTGRPIQGTILEVYAKDTRGPDRRSGEWRRRSYRVLFEDGGELKWCWFCTYVGEITSTGRDADSIKTPEFVGEGVDLERQTLSTTRDLWLYKIDLRQDYTRIKRADWPPQCRADLFEVAKEKMRVLIEQSSARCMRQKRRARRGYR